MDNKEIFEKINQILVEEFEVDQEVIEAENNLRESLNLDSLDYVDLVVLIESNFGVKLVEADFTAIVTFQDFYDLIERKITQK
ncbi:MULTISPECIES: acyl carrier protein [Myroides]|jgi:acyl carrier protein|uniref:Acyl carrier protein n=1 Tax=Myroides odoratus TaxID=256 RepID=A0A378U2V9_MYROD|nr:MULTISPECIES: phosphopantetheine-binding protein [Myroides]MDH6602273.1 acyl carrier protein [Myroides gitamensis]EHQ42559.1 Acyl carrier protein [Myroides odoratus DSM 2801]EKB07940.1 acyl carrier protein [Myroides odoratus CIP 103059]MCS4239344.1 acyl carrier protein [Myroides odoratus]MDR0224599.1 phosphopantetheine-binding protein [Myroides odoratus]